MQKEVYTTDNKVTWYTTETDIEEKLVSILGQKFIEYREKWSAVNKFELVTDFPLYLQVELNQVCNLRCPTCTIGIPEASQKYISTKKMSWDIFEKIILEGEKYNCPSLNPQGINEPLLDTNLEQYIHFASKHGFFDIIMNTNGTLLSEERARSLLKCGITRLRFSLDAVTEETYKKVRIGGNYSTVMKNIDRFIQLKKELKLQLPVIGMNFVKTSFNEHEEKQFIEKWSDVADFVTIQEFVPPETEHDYSVFFPSDSIYRTNMIDGFNCQQPWQRFFIHNTGDVCPCCAFFSSELSIGNVAQNSLYDLWHSNSMNNLREIHKTGEFWKNDWCKKCVIANCNMKEDQLIKIQSKHNAQI